MQSSSIYEKKNNFASFKKQFGKRAKKMFSLFQSENKKNSNPCLVFIL